MRKGRALPRACRGGPSLSGYLSRLHAARRSAGHARYALDAPCTRASDRGGDSRGHPCIVCRRPRSRGRRKE
eukprot:64159-Alexandrium_andersonii.AAC.1